MSQEKVARYKEEKLNRKNNLKKEKRKRMLRNSVFGLVVAVFVGWVGVSAYDLYKDKQPKKTAEVNYDDLNAYLENMSKEASE